MYEHCCVCNAMFHTSNYLFSNKDAKQKHLRYKKGEANQKQQLSDLYIRATKSFDISKGQELADYR